MVGLGKHHRGIHALDLRVGVMDGVTVAVPGGLDDVDEAHEPVDRLVEPARAERGAVAAFVHGREQAGEQDAMHEHHRQHEQGAARQIDAGSTHPDRGKMPAEIGQSDPIIAARELLAVLLVNELKRVKHHLLAFHTENLLRALRIPLRSPLESQKHGYKAN